MRRESTNVFPEGRQAEPWTAKGYIGISLNNSVSGMPSLLTQVFDWGSRNLINGFDLLLGDILERHNYEAFDGVEAEAAIERSLQDGAQIARHLRAMLLRSGVPNTKLLCASTLSSDPTFNERLARFHRQYTHNQLFRKPIDDAIASFIARRHPSTIIDDRVLHHCIDYQLEELVIFELLAEAGYGIFVYPGSQLPVMKRLVSGSLLNVSRSLERLLLVELRLFT